MKFSLDRKYVNVINAIPFLLLFAILIISDRWYFLQDDNYSQFTPIIIDGMDAFYSGKGFPTYSMYTLLGVPTSSLGTCAFFYPVLHVSYLISKYILGDVYQMNNVFALIHFFVGYLYCIRIFRQHRLNNLHAVLGSLLFIFCGFNLVATRSWYYIAPSVAFFPMLFFYLNKWDVSVLSIKKLLYVIVLLVLYGVSGNIQFFVYSLFVLFLYLAIRGGNWKKFYYTIRFFLITGGVTAIIIGPLLLTMFLETRGLKRDGCDGCGISAGITQLFGIPLEATMPCGLGAQEFMKYNTQFYQGAGPLLFLAFFLLTYRFIKHSNRFGGFIFQPLNALIILFFFSFVMALGNEGFLWQLQCDLPVLKSFRLPFKFLFYCQFFGILIGVKFVSIKLAKNPLRLSWLYFMGIGVYLCWHVVNSKQALFLYSYKQPYPAAEWHTRMKARGLVRVHAVVPHRSHELNYETALGLNFATSYGYLSTSGYEPLNNVWGNTLGNLSEYGTQYIIVSKHKEQIWMRNYMEDFDFIKSSPDFNANFDTIFNDEKITLIENKKVTPLMEVYNSQNEKIPCDFSVVPRGDGADFNITSIDSTQTPDHIMLNFIYRDAIRVFVDDEEKKIRQDSLLRIHVMNVHQASSVKLRYSPYSWKFYKEALLESRRDRKIRETVKTIYSSKDWMKDIRTKARERSIPVDSMVYLDAVWLLDNYPQEE